MIDNPISDIISKDLRRWFKEKWVDVSRKDKDGKHPPCGRDEAKTDSKGYPKCRPSKKVSEDTPKTSRSMSSKEKKSATRRKRSKPQGVGGKPTIVKTDGLVLGDVREQHYKDLLEETINQMASSFSQFSTDENAKSILSMLRTLQNQPIDDIQRILEEVQDNPRFKEFQEIFTPLRELTDEFDQDWLYAMEDENTNFTASSDPFELAWDSISKGRFRGYTRSNISDRPYRQAEHRVWDVSRKVKRERTKKRYARNKSRGTVRPAMRRQLGAGGKRAQTKR